MKRRPLPVNGCSECLEFIKALNMKTVYQYVSDDGNKKVEIFQREDGSYGFIDWHYDSEADAWFPHGRHSECFASTEEIVLREARGRVDWLGSQDRDTIG